MRALLCGHVDYVNTVKFWQHTGDQSSIILSGSVDKTLRVWQVHPESPLDFRLTATLEGHESSVNCLAASKGTNLVASGSADATVKLWRLQSAKGVITFSLVQTIQPKPRLFPLALSLHLLGTASGLFLAVAGTTNAVQVYVTAEDGVFVQQAILTGHDGWVRDLAITQEHFSADSDLILGSASQDKYIRLWRITKANVKHHEEGNGLIETSPQSLSNKSHKLKISSSSYTVTFEALLLGHEDWIYTIAWHLSPKGLQLLSASADNSLAMWQSEESSGLWVCTTRLGEISAQKGSTTATGSTGGFWIGLWSPSGNDVVSLGRTGGWRLWNYDRDHNQWAQGVAVGGHTKSVTDIAWSKNGAYILSIGSDQTTRLHADTSHDAKKTWHEMARPQIHGYDLNCIDSINQMQFVSGADEKLLRVFDEPVATAKLLDHLCAIKLTAGQAMPEAANIPVLGLSNKAVKINEDMNPPATGNNNIEQLARERTQGHGPMLIEGHPPFEDQLAKHTLWPEREKLYGHGFEIASVAASHDGELIATSCKASSLEHAVIRLYRTRDWRAIKPSLVAHTLTVTALCFSEDDQYLLSVSRDRQWAIFKREQDQQENYRVKHMNSKGHSRMILSACWAPLAAGRIFVTVSRDKTVKIWRFSDVTFECAAIIPFTSSVTAIDIFPLRLQDRLVIASGTEAGEVLLHELQLTNWAIQCTSRLDAVWVLPLPISGQKY